METTDPRAKATLRGLLSSLLGAALLCSVAGCSSGDSDPKIASITSPIGPQPTVSGTTFHDPQGAYTITVPGSWTENSGTSNGDIKSWLVGPESSEFSANVNVITQPVPGIDLEEYLKASSDAAPRQMENFKLVSRGLSDLGFGVTTGRIGVHGADQWQRPSFPRDLRRAQRTRGRRDIDRAACRFPSTARGG